ncbi:alpha/beta hydrolase [Coniochaeta ligniaria NRRL 30616]|uniref:Alpha/beta hydrolase n=1 Tax=Coniochaeta ligniaria NRRL 30616 TaxID=1408157 RepID=A0A1J7IST3_9PEZI|nr:alpha/beta hydrolase [Coniochaeta ligniaria NRRL 30616]
MTSLETKNFYPRLQRNVTSTASGSRVVSYTSDYGPDVPILTLIHGYPQSALIWRNVAPMVFGTVSLFIPELPGYGISTPAKDNSRQSIGGALLEALQSVFGIDPDSKSTRKVILGGHDRGARICHRLAVSKADFPALDVVGAILIDIVPTKVQWDRFSNPAISKGYYHWPFLANVELAVQMLKAYGGAKWARDQHRRLMCSQRGQRRMESDGALDVYAALFDKEETLRYSCEDYAAGAEPEYAQQAEDQKAGRKIDVPLMVMFSETMLGSRLDVAEEWKDWIKEGTPYRPVPIGEYGHYLPEEAHDVVSKNILTFVKHGLS